MKEAVANKNRHWSTPIFGQFYDKMFFGVLINCIILTGDVLTIHCKNVGAD